MHARIWLFASALALFGLAPAMAQDARPAAAVPGEAQREIVVEMRVAWLSEAALEALGQRLARQFPGEEDGELPAWMNAVLDDKQLAEVMAVLDSDRRCSMLQTPKITMLDGRQATLQVGEEHFFLTGIEANTKPGEDLTFHPKQTTIFIGQRHVLRPTLERDGRTVRLEVHAQFSELAGPVPLMPIQIPLPSKKGQAEKGQAEAFQMFLQQPVVHKLTVNNTFKIRDGHTQLVHVGRLTRETRTEHGVPVLAKVPYLSRLFRTVGYGRETQVLVVFLTPRVMGRSS
jgi:type II secretory pathway component GspD/PulD (secretin)